MGNPLGVKKIFFFINFQRKKYKNQIAQFHVSSMLSILSFFIQFQFCNSSLPNMYNNWFLSFKITMGTMHMVISAAIASCAKYIVGYCKYPQGKSTKP